MGEARYCETCETGITFYINYIRERLAPLEKHVPNSPWARIAKAQLAQTWLVKLSELTRALNLITDVHDGQARSIILTQAKRLPPNPSTACPAMTQ